MDDAAMLATRRSRRHVVLGTLTLAGFGLLSACGVLPPQTPPPATVRRVGFLAPSPDDNPMFVHGLAEHGYVEGQNIAVEYRYAGEAVYQLLVPAAELASLPVDLIVAVGTPAATADRPRELDPSLVPGGDLPSVPVRLRAADGRAGAGLDDRHERPAADGSRLLDASSSLRSPFSVTFALALARHGWHDSPTVRIGANASVMVSRRGARRGAGGRAPGAGRRC
jgi:hypothetical protein